MVDSYYLINHSSDAAFVVDGGVEIVAWNQAARQLLGFAPDEVIGRRCSDVIHAHSQDGELICAPNCNGVQCFRLEKPFAANACIARQYSPRHAALQGQCGSSLPLNACAASCNGCPEPPSRPGLSCSLISASSSCPYAHYDEPEILPYQNPSMCPKGADVRHLSVIKAFGTVEPIF